MIKKENINVMITCTSKEFTELDYLCKYYELSKTNVIRILIAKEYDSLNGNH